jgi:hypothetical protein
MSVSPRPLHSVLRAAAAAACNGGLTYPIESSLHEHYHRSVVRLPASPSPRAASFFKDQSADKLPSQAHTSASPSSTSGSLTEKPKTSSSAAANPKNVPLLRDNRSMSAVTAVVESDVLGHRTAKKNRKKKTATFSSDVDQVTPSKEQGCLLSKVSSSEDDDEVYSVEITATSDAANTNSSDPECQHSVVTVLSTDSSEQTDNQHSAEDSHKNSTSASITTGESVMSPAGDETTVPVSPAVTSFGSPASTIRSECCLTVSITIISVTVCCTSAVYLCGLA